MKQFKSIVLLLTLCAVALGLGRSFHEEITTDDDSEDGETIFVRRDCPRSFLA